MTFARRMAAGPHPILFLAARLSFGLFFALTSSYCLLAYIPFTYQWVIKCTLVAWLPVFVKFHTVLYWAAWAVVMPTLRADFSRAKTRRLTLGFIIFHAVVGVMLSIHPLLPSLGNDDASFSWSLISLFPLVWLAAIDHEGRGVEFAPSPQAKGGHFGILPFVSSAVSVSTLYLLIFHLRFGSAGPSHFKSSEMAVIISLNFASYLALFTGSLLVLRLVHWVAGRFHRPSEVEFIICNLLATVMAALIIKSLILPPLSFNSRRADLFSLVFASCIMAFLSGLSMRIRGFIQPKPDSGFKMLLLPLLVVTPGKESSRMARITWLVIVGGLAYLIPARISTMDWDFLMQKLAAISIWILVFASFYAAQSHESRRKGSAVAMTLVAVLSFGLYGGLRATAPLLPALLGDEGLDVNATLERYAGYDVSFKVVRDILHPDINLFQPTKAASVEAGEPEAGGDSFYTFLKQNTGLLPSVKVSPVEINLAERLAEAGGEKPNIFIFVIDSLRQDYLSPYNKAVDFTPNIAAFARESLVMKNAFTRYGGTVLAEPSIWAGAMQLHKQYIEPFYPMNALQKLIETEGYENLITVDPVLEIIMKPSPEVVELNKGQAWFQYDLCQSLGEIKSRIGERQSGGRPLFVYTQPQNIHRMVLTKRGEVVPPGESYPGFYEHYASQVSRMDGCFGEFIEYLKEHRLYDNSVVILTSDHGDSLNEEGRWGHNYWMFPEIIRIPLVVHLPARFQKNFVCDLNAIAFSTDITPSLYYLLGHRPIARDAIFGRPLFTATHREQTDYLQDSYLIASSYGPVYGTLSHNGRSLFISDAVNEKDYYFDLAEDPKGTRNRVTAAIRAEHQKLIRDQIAAINRFYKVGQ
ncbi:MAG TPA: sulfatase-like hydrolase/transferase [Blastocatellia bacterium]|nr:sulfatase-like hydrolase/transferase [Blastocatellia bacterium]